jgi:hypothetical protein
MPTDLVSRRIVMGGAQCRLRARAPGDWRLPWQLGEAKSNPAMETKVVPSTDALGHKPRVLDVRSAP